MDTPFIYVLTKVPGQQQKNKKKKTENLKQKPSEIPIKSSTNAMHDAFYTFKVDSRQSFDGNAERLYVLEF